MNPRQNDPDLLHDVFRVRAEGLISAIARDGLPFVVFETVRSNARQAALYAKGRRWDAGAGLWSVTAPSAVVTWAKPGRSPHAWGLAMDCILVPGHDWFEGETPPSGPWDDGGARPAVALAWEKYGRLAEACELVWGGRWSSKRDLPHVEMPRWEAHRPKAWRDIVARSLQEV